ncbi:MAG TPA: hypothetical protein VN578_21515 [Candidatus Binatia bacterium]|jgi:hypothetical protein|nr:hypothetical protein [Candidatus Binatia bacterium]
MIVGVDFDNTIVRYDDLFHRIAVERGLIPAVTSARKNEVRDLLRRRGQERDWTELQGYVYGPRMAEAQPFPGVLEFFTRAVRQGLPVYIISHKTPAPVVGPAYDLHQTARDWLAQQGFFDAARVGLSPQHVFFGTTRQEKIRLIQETGCTHFIDDLKETFLEEIFPPGVVKILFGHRQAPPGLAGVTPAADWAQVTEYVFDATN